MRTLFFSVLITLCCFHNLFAQNDVPLIRFGLIADIQYCDCDASGNRFYRNSLQKLDKCVVDLNKEHVQFTINLGDIVDRDSSSFEPVLNILNKLETPIYNTTGNHDYDGITDNNALYKRLGMPAEYYSFKKNGWVFIMLNTNEIASYANVKDTEKETELTEMLQIAKETGRKNASSWNGGISMKQMDWLKNLLSEAEKSSENVLIFSHHPFYPENGLMALNNREILELVSKYSCVKAMIAGHHHPGAFALYENIPVITVEGMIETEKENAYGIVEIYSDKILLHGKERMTTRKLVLEK